MVEWSMAEGRRLLAEIVDLAAEFSWLYDFHGTQILRCGVLNAVPADWRSTLAGLDNKQLNGLALCETQSGYPPSLQRFLQRCRQLSIHTLLPDTDTQDHPPLTAASARGICTKKRHEVVHLSTLVEQVTGRCGARAVLDIGAGLGYVDSLLHHQLGLRVLAAESEAVRVTQARARHVKLCGRECSALQFVTWQLRDNKETVQKAGAVVEQLASSVSVQDCGCQDAAKLSRSGRIVENIMATAPKTDGEGGDASQAENRSDIEAKLFESGNITDCNYGSPGSFDIAAVNAGGTVLLLGLHSCADLSPLMIRIFMCCSKISSLVLLSCCYHKMKTIKSTGAQDQTDDELFEHVNIDEDMDEQREEEDEEAEDTRMSETSEGYESDVSYETLPPSKPCKTAQKNVPGPFATPRSRHDARSSSGAPPHHCGPAPRRRRSSPDSDCLFQNFPLSRSLSVLMCRRGFSLSGYGLRLACQEPGLRWKNMSEDDHRKHENALFFRGVLDNVCLDGGIVLTKQKRRCVTKEQFSSFESYLTSIVDGYTASFKSGQYCDSHSSTSHSSPQSTSFMDTMKSSSSHLLPSTSTPRPATHIKGSVSSHPVHMAASSSPLIPSSAKLARHSIDNILVSDCKATSSVASPQSSSGSKCLNAAHDSKCSSVDGSPSKPSGECCDGGVPDRQDNSNKPSTSAGQQQACSMHCLKPALRACHDQHLHLAPLLEAVTGLQLAMQGVLEALVLLDRVLYALESQFCSSVQLVKVFDAMVSPRCVAMVLYK